MKQHHQSGHRNLAFKTCYNLLHRHLMSFFHAVILVYRNIRVISAFLCPLCAFVCWVLLCNLACLFLMGMFLLSSLWGSEELLLVWQRGSVRSDLIEDPSLCINFFKVYWSCVFISWDLCMRVCVCDWTGQWSLWSNHRSVSDLMSEHPPLQTCTHPSAAAEQQHGGMSWQILANSHKVTTRLIFKLKLLIIFCVSLFIFFSVRT